MTFPSLYFFIALPVFFFVQVLSVKILALTFLPVEQKKAVLTVNISLQRPLQSATHVLHVLEGILTVEGLFSIFLGRLL